MEDLVNALENLQEAREVYKEACKGCEYDRGYFLYREQQEIEAAKKQLELAFHKAVAKVIRKILNGEQEDENNI